MRNFLPTGVEVGGVSGGRVPREGTQPGKTQGTLHVSSLEVEYGNTTVRPKLTSTVQSLWDTLSRGETCEAQEDGQMQECDIDLPKAERHRDGGEVWGN